MMSLGEVLRAWRERASPADAGLPAGGHRRTPGLRREELAWLAGVSADYVKRLEQGRAHPSGSVVRALARALQVSQEDYHLLARLAGHAAPPEGQVPQHIPASVRRLTDRLADVPVAIYDATWTLLATNDLWIVLFSHLASAEGRERNLVWRWFTRAPGETGPVGHSDPERHERSLVADVRDALSRYPADPELRAMVDDLRRTSARFGELWDQPTTARHGGHRKPVLNPVVGELTLDCDVLTVHDSDLRVVVFTTEPGTPDADKLATLGLAQRADLIER